MQITIKNKQYWAPSTATLQVIPEGKSAHSTFHPLSEGSNVVELLNAYGIKGPFTVKEGLGVIFVRNKKTNSQGIIRLP